MHSNRHAHANGTPAARKNSFGAPLVDAAFTREEARQFAQSVVDEKALKGPDELRRADREVYDLAAETGALGSLVFAAGGAKQAGGRPEPDEQAMYKRICSECFRMSNGNPYVGSRRATIEQLRSAISKRLKGKEHKLFDKCWSRMAAEGAIIYNSNSTAASLDPFAEGVRDPQVREALRWAIGEQASANPEWRARYGNMFAGQGEGT